MEPQQHDSPLSHEPGAKQPNLYLSSPNHPSPAGHRALRLIWHLCQLCNLTASNISSYLTLEALARDTADHGAFDFPLFGYQPAMGAHVMMLQVRIVAYNIPLRQSTSG